MPGALSPPKPSMCRSSGIAVILGLRDNMHLTDTLALGSGLDRVQLAKLLRRAHKVAIETGQAPSVVRKTISDSWRRSLAAGVDPGRPAPRLFDARTTASHLAEHPVAPALPLIAELLGEELVGSGYFAAFSDADGVLLWTDGPPRALQTAIAPRFLPGCLCSEERVGTNAIGTALVLDRAIQIFSAEHFSELLHGWVCAAAPVHDPDTGKVIGAIDISGRFQTGQAHSLALIAAVAKALEATVAKARRETDDRLRASYQERYGSSRSRFRGLVAPSGRVLSAEPYGWLGASVDIGAADHEWRQCDGTSLRAEPFGAGFVVWRAQSREPRPQAISLTITPDGRDRAVIQLLPAGRRVALRPRHAELVTLLALHPAGLTVRELSQALYGASDRERTVTAEIRRLRDSLGDVLLSRPYRLASRVQIRSPGLLADSTAPGIVTARERLEGAAFMQPFASSGGFAR